VHKVFILSFFQLFRLFHFPKTLPENHTYDRGSDHSKESECFELEPENKIIYPIVLLENAIFLKNHDITRQLCTDHKNHQPSKHYHDVEASFPEIRMIHVRLRIPHKLPESVKDSYHQVCDKHSPCIYFQIIQGILNFF